MQFRNHLIFYMHVCVFVHVCVQQQHGASFLIKVYSVLQWVLSSTTSPKDDTERKLWSGCLLWRTRLASFEDLRSLKVALLQSDGFWFPTTHSWNESYSFGKDPSLHPHPPHVLLSGACLFLLANGAVTITDHYKGKHCIQFHNRFTHALRMHSNRKTIQRAPHSGRGKFCSY